MGMYLLKITMQKETQQMETYLNDKIQEIAVVFSISEKEACSILMSWFLVDSKKNAEEIDYIKYWIAELEEEQELTN